MFEIKFWAQSENQNRNLILGFEVPISYFSQMQIEILVLVSRFIIFPKPNFSKMEISNFGRDEFCILTSF